MQIKLIEDEDVIKENEEYQCCNLCKTRNKMVWIRGTNDKNVDVVFVGEAPGKEEDLYGKPFVGRSGKLLDTWILRAGLDNYAIINIVKCRPPDNRTPNPREIESCLPLFRKQMKELNPKLIVALGRIACGVLIGKVEIVANIGKVFTTRYGKVIIFPHPSFILRGASIDIPTGKLKNILRQLKTEIEYDDK